MFRSQRQANKGFSLIELLVILAVLAFLVGMLVPAVQKVREAAARTECSNNLRQLGLAMHNINDAYAKLPPVAGPFPAGNKSYGTYFYHILPFIEQQPLWQKGNNYVWKNGTYSNPIRTYICPADASSPPNGKYKDWLATCNYAANWQVFGKGGARIPATFQDGTSNTIVFTERYQMCNDTPCAWGYPGVYYWSPMFAYYSHGKFQPEPTQKKCNPALAQSVHATGIPVGMADASVRHVSNNLSPQTWWYACTPNGGETLGADWKE
jgi:type II secretory pathway pseudopilin PulG